MSQRTESYWCSYSPGKSFCTGGGDGSLRIWNPKSAESTHVVQGLSSLLRLVLGGVSRACRLHYSESCSGSCKWGFFKTGWCSVTRANNNPRQCLLATRPSLPYARGVVFGNSCGLLVCPHGLRRHNCVHCESSEREGTSISIIYRR